MRERSEFLLKAACALLAALLLFRVARVVIGGNPLAHTSIPALPSLPVSAETPAGGKGTNAVGAMASGEKGTNRPPRDSRMTNLAASKGVVASGTNATRPKDVPGKDTNSLVLEDAAGAATNRPPRDSGMTNITARTETNSAPTNVLAKTGTNTALLSGSNGIAGGAPGAGNLPAGMPATMAVNSAVVKLDTNSPAHQAAGTNKTKGLPQEMAQARMSGGQFPMGGAKPAELPPGIQARVDRITDSEILGPVIRPLPMALLGIGGNTAFLRAPSGQTGLVKEGEEVGGIKLLRIGINRVLIEQDGQKKELTMFSGYGGESLLPKSPDTTNETTNR
jgi:hypothetical protein